MSINESSIIDGIAVNNDQQLVLLIADHLDWSMEYDHLRLLQNKINAYLSYCESGQYKQLYPERNFRSALIEIHFAFEPTGNAKRLLSNVQSKLAELGIEIECYVD